MRGHTGGGLKVPTSGGLDGHFTGLVFEVPGHAFVQDGELPFSKHVRQLDVLPGELPLGVNADGGGHGTERRGREL